VAEPQTRIVLRPIGSPLTIGMSGLAVGSLVQSGLDLGWIAQAQVTQVGLILIAIPFVLQLVACVVAYLARDGAAGAALGVLSGTWLAIGLVHVIAVPGQRSGAMGLMMLASAGTLTLSSIAVAVAKPLPAGLFLIVAARFALGGVYELGGPDFWRDAAGVIGLLITAVAAYSVLAFELEGQRHAPVLPTFRRGRGHQATTAGIIEQIEEIANEPGVRQTS
jgi:succinate-acetate transporter protein